MLALPAPVSPAALAPARIDRKHVAASSRSAVTLQELQQASDRGCSTGPTMRSCDAFMKNLSRGDYEAQ
jgi:hypothetical protein